MRLHVDHPSWVGGACSQIYAFGAVSVLGRGGSRQGDPVLHNLMGKLQGLAGDATTGAIIHLSKMVCHQVWGMLEPVGHLWGKDTGDEVGRAGQRSEGYLLLSLILWPLTLGLREHWQHIHHPPSHQCFSHLFPPASVPLASPFAIDLCSFELLGFSMPCGYKSLWFLIVPGHWYLGHQTHDIRSFSM